MKSTFFAIDFDRCLSKSDVLIDIFMHVLDDLDIISFDTISAIQKEVELTGKSFQILIYLRDNGYIDEASQAKVSALFCERALARRSEHVAEDADELFAYLHENNIHHAIISFGGHGWQELKLQASGLDVVPHQIVSHPRKSDELRSWMTDDGFLLPRIFDGVSVDDIVLIDDKAVAFDNLPPHVRGYWMQIKGGELLPSQQGTVPDSVQIVYDFKSIIEKEKSL